MHRTHSKSYGSHYSHEIPCASSTQVSFLLSVWIPCGAPWWAPMPFVQTYGAEKRAPLLQTILGKKLLRSLLSCGKRERHYPIQQTNAHPLHNTNVHRRRTRQSEKEKSARPLGISLFAMDRNKRRPVDRWSCENLTTRCKGARGSRDASFPWKYLHSQVRRDTARKEDDEKARSLLAQWAIVEAGVTPHRDKKRPRELTWEFVGGVDSQKLRHSIRAGKEENKKEKRKKKGR